MQLFCSNLPVMKTVLDYLTELDQIMLKITCFFWINYFSRIDMGSIRDCAFISTVVDVTMPHCFEYTDHIEVRNMAGETFSSILSFESLPVSETNTFYGYYHPPTGWGLYALKTIMKDTLICYYTGELCKLNELQRRLREEYLDKEDNYVLVVREHSRPHFEPAFMLRTIIDATRRGNFSRFINHSCDPNAEITMTRLAGSSEVTSVLGVPTVVARRSIAPGEQICFDYGDCELFEQSLKAHKKSGETDAHQCDEVLSSSVEGSPRSRKRSSSALEEGANQGGKKCHCMSTCCRGTLPVRLF